MIILKRAPIAQLDRASGYGPEGLGFKSLWVYHFFCLLHGYLSSKSDIRIFLPILLDSVKFIPSQTENATFLPHKFIPSVTSKKIEKFLIARSYSYGRQNMNIPILSYCNRFIPSTLMAFYTGWRTLYL